MDSTRPLAKVNDQVYEDIDPKMEWVNQLDSTTYLSVYLMTFYVEILPLLGNMCSLPYKK